MSRNPFKNKQTDKVKSNDFLKTLSSVLVTMGLQFRVNGNRTPYPNVLVNDH